MDRSFRRRTLDPLVSQSPWLYVFLQLMARSLAAQHNYPTFPPFSPTLPRRVYDAGLPYYESFAECQRTQNEGNVVRQPQPLIAMRC